MIQPKDDGPVGQELVVVAEEYPNRFARMCNAIDSFVLDEHTPGYRIDPPEPEMRYVPDTNLQSEIYLVPHLLEDAAAVLEVEHSTKEIRFILVLKEFGGAEEHDQWRQILIQIKRHRRSG